jgi:hypothetical protein
MAICVISLSFLSSFFLELTCDSFGAFKALKIRDKQATNTTRCSLAFEHVWEFDVDV